MRPNEEYCINKFRILYSKRLNKKYIEYSRPEENNYLNGKKIEMILKDEKENDFIAIEHTKIETFTKQLETSAKVKNLIKQLNDELCNFIPKSAYYRLLISIKDVHQIKKKNIKRIIAELKDIIRKEIWNVKDGNIQKIRISNLTNDIGLEYGGSYKDLNGEIIPSVYLENNFLLKKTEKRVQRAFKDKISKLLKHKSNNTKTCLILEDNDYQLTNYQFIKEIILKIKKKYFLKRWPDIIFYILQDNLNLSEARFVKEKKKWFDSIENNGPFYKENFWNFVAA